MKKKIKDMTAEEKAIYIQHMSYKFHDANTTPSTLLLEEIRKNHIKDKSVWNDFKELESLEVQHYNLEQEYSATILREIAPLKRVFEYEQEELRKKYQYRVQQPGVFNPLNKFAKVTTAEQYDQERRKLLQAQAERKTEIEKAAKKPMDECHKKIYAVFMRAIRRIYR